MKQKNKKNKLHEEKVVEVLPLETTNPQGFAPLLVGHESD